MAQGSKRKEYSEYVGFIEQVGHGQLDGVDITHDGYPLSVAESKFISVFVATGNINQSLRDANLALRDVSSKEYITDEIKYRLDELRKKTIADADEIMQYFTAVMRGEIKDQFGLDAPLCERTAAAKELAKRIIDVEMLNAQQAVPELKITLNWE